MSPKYAVIVNAIQSRIERGVYPPGEMLPSEAQLVREFGASRSTVVRALEYLRQLGWLTGVQGKGRIALGRPAAAQSPPPARIRGVLDVVEATDATLLRVGPVPAPRGIAHLLAISEGAELVARQRTVAAGGGAPVSLDTVYAPALVARRTGLDATAPISDGLLRRLLRHGLLPHHVVEHLGARSPSAGEASTLAIDPRRCVVALLLVVRDQAGQPLLAVDCVLPAGHPMLRASFGLT
ncbi:MAG TPA: GntR family transcriptional regulator [Micromonosporaceae bacterium]|nr:GntR family transcriptional regulator [Micromonosporaceae bacterium]